MQPPAREPILVVGSVALDSLETPFGKVDETLGGSATYFSAAASFFAPVRLVAVVGDDLPRASLEFLAKRGVDLSGLEVVEGGRTFRWSGRYHYDLNSRDTLGTWLNVFERFEPKLPAGWNRSRYVFLANIDPVLQRRVLDQIHDPELVVMDTMNYWMGSRREELLDVLRDVDVFIVNDAEARELSREPNLIKAAQRIRAAGPERVVIKKGEHGALLFGPDGIFSAPAFPLEDVFDPTGAGDTFAGGFLGSVAGDAERAGGLDRVSLRRAVVYGSALASFAVERFGCERLRDLSRPEIERRFAAFRALTEFDSTNTPS